MGARAVAMFSIVVVLGLGSGTAANAHTETDVVAVPAGSEATIRLRPQHGCGGSPTVAVSVRAPVADATAGEVTGWLGSSTPDGNGNTVLTWTGGVLPADEPGSFPVVLSVPDVVGELLTFPAVQECENGDELAWISGNPTDEFPAPRLLVLAAGASIAATIDEVPLDAPGRDQLVAIVDVDNPNAPATTTSATTTAPVITQVTTTAVATTDGTATVPEVTDSDVTSPGPAVETTAPTGADGADSSIGWFVLAVALVAALAAALLVWLRRRRGVDQVGG